MQQCGVRVDSRTRVAAHVSMYRWPCASAHGVAPLSTCRKCNSRHRYDPSDSGEECRRAHLVVPIRGPASPLERASHVVLAARRGRGVMSHNALAKSCFVWSTGNFVQIGRCWEAHTSGRSERASHVLAARRGRGVMSHHASRSRALYGPSGNIVQIGRCWGSYGGCHIDVNGLHEFWGELASARNRRLLPAASWRVRGSHADGGRPELALPRRVGGGRKAALHARVMRAAAGEIIISLVPWLGEQIGKIRKHTKHTKHTKRATTARSVRLTDRCSSLYADGPMPVSPIFPQTEVLASHDRWQEVRGVPLSQPAQAEYLVRFGERGRHSTVRRWTSPGPSPRLRRTGAGTRPRCRDALRAGCAPPRAAACSKRSSGMGRGRDATVGPGRSRPPGEAPERGAPATTAPRRTSPTFEEEERTGGVGTFFGRRACRYAEPLQTRRAFLGRAWGARAAKTDFPSHSPPPPHQQLSCCSICDRG